MMTSFNDVKMDSRITEALYIALRPAYAKVIEEMSRRGCDKRDLLVSSVSIAKATDVKAVA